MGITARSLIAMLALLSMTGDALLQAGRPSWTAQLTKELRGPDAAGAEQELLDMLAEEPAKTAAIVHRDLAPGLLAAGRYDLLLRITDAAIMAAPDQTAVVEGLQEDRVRSYRGLGRMHEALAEAKRLYNVATMDRTANAIAILAETFAAACPEDPAGATRLKLEQLKGAHWQPGSPACISDTLRTIQTDASHYRRAAEQMGGQDYESLIGRGNLLLLADQPEEAYAAMVAAYAVAPARRLREATEHVARAMRAQDGTVGRANGWLLSLRPAQGPTSREPQTQGAMPLDTRPPGGSRSTSLALPSAPDRGPSAATVRP